MGVILWLRAQNTGLRAQFVRIEVNYPDTGEPTKQSNVSRIGSTQRPGYLGEAKKVTLNNYP
ncbi:MAG: hypothetical protein WBJ37_05675 [Bacteroidales bacterium]